MNRVSAGRGGGPLLGTVEQAGLRAGLPVDARVETGRTPTHALERLWDVERFDPIVVPASAGRNHGFPPKELEWILVHAPYVVEGLRLAGSLEAVA